MTPALDQAFSATAPQRSFPIRLVRRLRPLLAPRFLKFCSVGATGVVVNLGVLMLLADKLGLHTNLASAIAIEASVISNFFLNEYWTFHDRRSAQGSIWQRGMQFHLVSLVGALVQWAVFIAGNVLWLWLAGDRDTFRAYWAQAGGSFVEQYVLYPIGHPAPVGAFKYLSQLGGIAVAVVWNFLANFYWTWRPDAQQHGAAHSSSSLKSSGSKL